VTLKKDSPDDRVREPGHPVTPAAETPPVQEYPKMLYHEDGRQLTVQHAEEAAAAKKEGFREQPGTEARPRPAKEPR
jgi:hypothetical protein